VLLFIILYCILLYTYVYSGEGEIDGDIVEVDGDIDEVDGDIDEVDGVSQYHPTFLYNPKTGQSYHMPILNLRNEEYTIITQPGDSFIRQNSAPPSISCGIQKAEC